MGGCCSSPETEQLLSILDRQEFGEAHQFFDSHRQEVDPDYYCPRGNEISWTIAAKLCSKTYRETQLLEKFLFGSKNHADLFAVPTSSQFNAIHVLLTTTSAHNQDDHEEQEQKNEPFVATNEDDDDDQAESQDGKKVQQQKQQSLTSPLSPQSKLSNFVKTLMLLFRAAGLIRGKTEEENKKFFAAFAQKYMLTISRNQLVFALFMVYLQANLGISPIQKMKSVVDFFCSQFDDFGRDVLQQQIDSIHRANTVSGVLEPQTTIFHILAAKDRSGEIFDQIMATWNLQQQATTKKNNNNSDVEMTDRKQAVSSSKSFISYMLNDDDDDENSGEIMTRANNNNENRNRLLLDSERRTPLMVACQSFNIEMARRFISQKMGGDVRHASIYGANVLHYLAAAVVPLPLSAANKNGEEALFNPNDSAARFFTAEQENAEEENIVTAAAKAAKKAREEAIKQRQDNFVASQTVSAELAAMALKMPGAKFAKEAVDSKRYTPLLYAIQNQNRPLVTVLLDEAQGGGVKKVLPEGFAESFKTATLATQNNGQKTFQTVDEFSDLFSMRDLVGKFGQK
jgi:hypothetical protein